MTVSDLSSRFVDQLVSDGSITAPDIEAAFRSTPRDLFLPGAGPDVVYADQAIPIKHGSDGLPISSSSQPSMMARMLAQLALSGGESVLEIGTGSGYNAALLGKIVGPDGHVSTVDIDDDLVARADGHLRSAGVTNVKAIAADGWFGFESDAPYDRIEVTVGVWDISPEWVDQLAPEGILVVPLWLRAGIQASIAFRRDGSDLVSIDVAPCGFMRMRGPHAGPETYVLLDGWILCDDLTDPVQREAARALLESPSTTADAPTLSSGWFTRIALSHPAPVRMWTVEDPWIDREGVMLPDGTGLAVIEGERVITFGDTKARDELLRLASIPGRSLEEAVVRAQTSLTSDGDAVFKRPAFFYTVAWLA